MSEYPTAHGLALRIAASLRAANIDYAIGGALALNLWGPARGTRDVDINVFVTDDQLDTVLSALEAAGVTLDRDQARRRAAREGMFVGELEKMRIDVFVPSIDFTWEAAQTRVSVQTPSGVVDFLSAEALAVFKLMFFRPKDLVDLTHLVAVQRDDMDLAMVRDRVVGMMGVDDERVVAWDRIVRDQMSLPP